MPHQRGRNGVLQEAVLEDDIQQYQVVMENHDPTATLCCVPAGCHIEEPINLDYLADVVKVICNNEHCQEGQFMHKLCFEQWEETVLTYLRSTGRARSWSEKQRLQNLWTKKGYDLAYKACGCKCGKGHLRKDLDWMPPSVNVDDVSRKKKGRKKKNDKPALTLNGNGTVGKQAALPAMRLRSSSMSSTGSGSGSPPSSASADCPLSPSFAASKKFFADRRERHGSGSIFSRRQDYSSFNTLPRHKINSYHIKMEDEGNQGNDETRCFILSTLSANKINRIACILCHNAMIIFDRYPLIDGTFFLSPRQHSKSSVNMKGDGRMQYLNAVCMACLEGWNTTLRCRYCQSRWNGSDLILGTMYSYDILAATPCCSERLRCNNCHRMVIMPEQRLQFFSDYSHSIACPHCGYIDFHFVKSLSTYHRKERE